MDQNQIVLNTLVFADQVTNKGVRQADLLAHLADFGISSAEIRREYLKNFDAEIPAIKNAATIHNVRLFYSVPEVLFLQGGQLNPALTQYFDEAKHMGMYAIKLNIGDFSAYTGNLAADFKPFLATGIQINVENDQTQQSGSSKNILAFLNAAQRANIDVQYVFDMGNWRFVGENEESVAKIIAQFVRYIHVKNVDITNQKPSVVPLDQGVIDWKKTLSELPSDVPVAIEYPATDTEITHAVALLKAL